MTGLWFAGELSRLNGWGYQWSQDQAIAIRASALLLASVTAVPTTTVPLSASLRR
jgi:hypothetical protein